MADPRLETALAAVDAANAADPRPAPWDPEGRPYELAYADRLERWVRALAPRPGDALRFAARAQHLRRWEIPRASYPDGRRGYLAWRRKLQDHHVEAARAILIEAGFAADGELARAVEPILRKQGVGSAGGADPEVQVMEDALCLVTLELQLGDLTARLDRDKMVALLARTWAKMSEAGRAQARALDLGPEAEALLAEALAGEGGDGPPGGPASGDP